MTQVLLSLINYEINFCQNNHYESFMETNDVLFKEISCSKIVIEDQICKKEIK